jgi:hypothetical protein
MSSVSRPVVSTRLVSAALAGRASFIGARVPAMRAGAAMMIAGICFIHLRQRAPAVAAAG